jgi:hypothetical protein
VVPSLLFLLMSDIFATAIRLICNSFFLERENKTT